MTLDFECIIHVYSYDKVVSILTWCNEFLSSESNKNWDAKTVKYIDPTTLERAYEISFKFQSQEDYMLFKLFWDF